MNKIIIPIHIDLIRWANELNADFSEQFLPILKNEEDFLEWASLVAGTGIFAQKGVPSPVTIQGGQKQSAFKDWQEWAFKVYMLFNDEFEFKDTLIK